MKNFHSFRQSFADPLLAGLRHTRSVFLVIAASVALSACITGSQTTNPNDNLRFAFEPRGEVTLTLTDNANLTESNRVGDAVLGITPGFNFRRRGPRLEASVDYSYNYLTFLESGETDGRHNLFGLVDLDVWRNRLAVEFRGSLQQTFLNRQAGLSGSIANISENRRLVQTYSTGLNFNTDIRDWVDVNTRYQFAIQLSPADNLDDPTITSNFSDTVSHDLTHSLSTGERFNRFFARGSVSVRRAIRSLDVNNFRDDRALAEAGYRFSEAFRVRGGVGWAVNDLQLAVNQEDGFTWDVGFDWTPSRRTSLSASYGREGSRQTTTIDFETEPTRRTRFIARYTDQIQAVAFELADGVENLSFDEDFGIVTSQGLPASTANPVFTLNDVDFRQKAASATLQWNHRRDAYFINGTYEERTFDDGSGTSITWGVSQSLRHSINPREEVTLSSSFRRNEFEGGERVDDNWRASVEYRKTFSRFFIGAMTYSYSYRNSSVQGGDLLENALTFYLRATF